MGKGYYLAPYPFTSCKLPMMRIQLSHPCESCSSEWSCSLYKISYVEMKPLPLQYLSLVFCVCFLCRKSLYPLCSHPLSTGILWWGSPWAFSGEKRPDSFSLFSKIRFFSTLIVVAALFRTFLSLSTSFLVYGDQNWTQYSRRSLTSAE